MQPTTPFLAIIQTAMSGLLWFIPLVLAVGGFALLLKPLLKGKAGERRVREALDRAGFETLHDVIVTREDGSLTQIDHVVNLGGCIAVIETKNYAGLIFGKEREATCTQRLGKTSRKFQNPLRQNYAHTKALQHRFPGVPFEGVVCFAGQAQFPKVESSGVVQSASLITELKGKARPLVNQDQTTAAAWAALTNHRAEQSKDMARAHLAGLRERHGRDLRKPISYGLLSASAAASILLFLR